MAWLQPDRQNRGQTSQLELPRLDEMIDMRGAEGTGTCRPHVSHSSLQHVGRTHSYLKKNIIIIWKKLVFF